jgi:N6-L-threonylcarbamoyladenine synthase
VARNTRLRTRFKEYAAGAGLPAFVPSPKLCTDNAAMVAAVAVRKFGAGGPGAALDLLLDAYPR